MAIWYLARKAGAPLPRRLVYVVDRRAVVDQATEVADAIKKKSGDCSLRVSTLRGQHVDNREWLGDPAATAIIVGTVDMIGSRLLFEGYGVSRRMRPYHAGLLGVDALMVLDESHLVPPFERLLERIAAGKDLGPRGEADRQRVPPFRLLALSATGRSRGDDVFRLESEDEDDPVIRQRLTARKGLSFREAGNGKLEDLLAEHAWSLSREGTLPARVLVYCDSRDVAEKTKAKIEDKAEKANVGTDTELFVGARRVKERVDAAARLKTLGFLAGSEVALERPAFLIATSAGEVGVDLDADHMVCDVVAWERMVQRFGRVNRLGKGDARIEVLVEPEPQPTKGEDAALNKRKNGHEIDAKEQKLIMDYEKRLQDWQARQEPLKRLPTRDNAMDVSPGALRELKRQAADDPTLQKTINAASTPEPLYPAVTRPLVEAWAMTSLEEHSGRPEVQPWLRGWIEDDPPQTSVVWRTYLPLREDGRPPSGAEMRAFFDAAPPHLAETLDTETFRVVAWLRERAKTITKRRQDAAQPDAAEPDLAPLSGESVVCIVLDRGDEPKAYTLNQLVDDAKDTKAFERMLASVTLVVNARFGGLKDGLLDGKADHVAVSAADGENGWGDGDGEPVVPFRVRRIKVAEENEALSEDMRWRPIYAFDVARTAEGEPVTQLIIEKWRGEAPDEEARSIATRSQSLSEHQDWTREKAEAVVTALGLDGELGKAIVLAARLHDEGKRAARWQDAFHTPSNGRPYAKSGSRRAPDFELLAGYRHEFGSLFHLEKDNQFGALPEDLKDLVRHLVVAHHGRARPVIETAGCEEGPPSLLAAHARDVALRFARLQKRFGPWGLAWLEALVRAADQQASRALEIEERGDG